MNRLFGWLFGAMALLVGTTCDAATLVFDDFNRADSSVVGNGWDEYSITPSGTPGTDMVSVYNNQLRVAHSDYGQNRDAGIFRSFAQICGLKVSGTVEWITGPRSGLSLHLNGTPQFNPKGLQLIVNSEYRNQQDPLPDRIAVWNDGAPMTLQQIDIELSLPNTFEWIIHQDCSTEARVWPIGAPRPSSPLITSPAISVTPVASPHLVIQGSGGAGCCVYEPFDMRFDNLQVSEIVVDPRARLEALVALVMSMNIQQGIANSLDAKLQRAIAALDDANANNDGAALNTVYAFCSSVEAQRGNKLTDEQASLLIESANGVVTSLDALAPLCQ